MTVANVLTALRALALIPTVFAVLAGDWWAAFALFLFALASDILDGWVARRARQVTLAGQLLDPVVDKVYYLGLFSALAAVGKVPPLALGMFALPQLGLGVGTLVLWGRRKEFVARWPGKAAALLTALAAALLILTPYGRWPLWGAVAAHIMSAAYYLGRQAKARTLQGAGREPLPRSR